MLVDKETAEALLKDVLSKDESDYESVIFSTRSYRKTAIPVICGISCVFIKFFIDAIGKLPKLEKVNLSDIYSGIETEEAQSVLEEINKALSVKKLKELDFSDNALGPLGIKSCKPVLENMSSLEKLMLCNDGLSGDAIGILSDIMCKNSHSNLKTLNFFNNMSGDEGAINVSKILKHHPSISDFRWASTRTGNIGGLELIKGLNELRNIESLDLNDNSLGIEAGLLLAKNIIERKESIINIKKLCLGDCGFEEEGISEIIKSLLEAKICNLEYLDLSYNNIGIKELFDLCKLLKENIHLKVLILSNNDFGNCGLKLINHLLSNYCNELEILNLNSNELNSYFVTDLCNILQKKLLFKTLNIDGNSINDDVIELMKEILNEKLCNFDDNIGDDEDNEEIDCNEVNDMINQF